jgi:hypothetical protein
VSEVASGWRLRHQQPVGLPVPGLVGELGELHRRGEVTREGEGVGVSSTGVLTVGSDGGG